MKWAAAFTVFLIDVEAFFFKEILLDFRKNKNMKEPMIKESLLEQQYAKRLILKF